MSRKTDTDLGPYAQVLAAGLADVVEELRAIDPVDLVSYIHFGRFNAIDDLLQSSTELFFKEGTLTFGWTAAVDMSWDATPKVTLGMEFHHWAVSVFFNLSLRAFECAVDIGGLYFDPSCQPPPDRLLYLAEAIEDAHLPKRWPKSPSRSMRPLF